MDIKKTISTIFFVPPLKIVKDALVDNNFINAYITDANSDLHYTDVVYLLFSPKNLNRFREFLDGEYERKAVIDDYNYKDDFVVVVYKTDVEYNDDFSLIKQGKYSKTSAKFQSLFPKIIKIKQNRLHRDELSLQYRIFNKTQDLITYWEEKFDVHFSQEQEIWHGFSLEEETLNFDKLK